VATTALSSREERFAALFDHEGPRVHALARRLCRGRDADDLVQETFLDAFRALDQLADPANPRPWLFAIAHRACMRMRRRRAGEPEHLESFDELLPTPRLTIPDVDALAADPHRDRLRAEAREIVERGLAELPESFRLPLLLADVAELKLAEIAAILDIEEATVKTRIHRARLKLRAILAAGLPQRDAPPARHSRDACLDLLRARLAAFDQGVEFPFSKAAMCERCQSVFATLDLAASVCASLERDRIPERLRTRILAATRR
jgi:RNA polymerase sigma-70 factor, ECF subfamily